MAEATTISAANPAPVPIKPTKRMLAEGKFALASYATNRWSVTLEHGVSYERVFEPDYWSHVARKMRIGDIVELHAEDATFFAELYVVAAHRLAAKVVELRRIELAASAGEEVESPYLVKWLGPAGQWGIKRLADNQTMQKGFASQADAEVAKAQLLRTLAA